MRKNKLVLKEFEFDFYLLCRHVVESWEQAGILREKISKASPGNPEKKKNEKKFENCLENEALALFRMKNILNTYGEVKK